MTILTSILGWQAFGIAVRQWQLGLQQRPQWTNPHLYPYILAFWGAVGYGVNEYEGHIAVILAERRARLEAKRAQRAELTAAKDAEAIQ